MATKSSSEIFDHKGAMGYVSNASDPTDADQAALGNGVIWVNSTTGQAFVSQDPVDYTVSPIPGLDTISAYGGSNQSPYPTEMGTERYQHFVLDFAVRLTRVVVNLNTPHFGSVNLEGRLYDNFNPPFFATPPIDTGQSGFITIANVMTIPFNNPKIIPAGVRWTVGVEPISVGTPNFKFVRQANGDPIPSGNGRNTAGFAGDFVWDFYGTTPTWVPLN